MRVGWHYESGVGQQSVNIGVVDIGTNTMRLLVTSAETEVGRWVEVTALGVGVDATGALSQEGMRRSLEAFERFGGLMDSNDVRIRKAIATSACRDASNRDDFFDRAAVALGVRPTLIDGEQEARYAFDGATHPARGPSGVVVCDIGGGSTEFVTADESVSIDIGSVRLSDRLLPHRPASDVQIESAGAHVNELFRKIRLLPDRGIGVAGTWTALSALAMGLERYDRLVVHGSVISARDLEGLVDRLAVMTLAETERLPSLDPKRAPVILPGAVIALEAMRVLGLDELEVSESDTLDAVAHELIEEIDDRS